MKLAVLVIASFIAVTCAADAVGGLWNQAGQLNRSRKQQGRQRRRQARPQNPNWGLNAPDTGPLPNLTGVNDEAPPVPFGFNGQQPQDPPPGFDNVGGVDPGNTVASAMANAFSGGGGGGGAASAVANAISAGGGGGDGPQPSDGDSQNGGGSPPSSGGSNSGGSNSGGSGQPWNGGELFNQWFGNSKGDPIKNAISTILGPAGADLDFGSICSSMQNGDFNAVYNNLQKLFSPDNFKKQFVSIATALLKQFSTVLGELIENAAKGGVQMSPRLTNFVAEQEAHRKGKLCNRFQILDNPPAKRDNVLGETLDFIFPEGDVSYVTSGKILKDLFQPLNKNKTDFSLTDIPGIDLAVELLPKLPSLFSKIEIPKLNPPEPIVKPLPITKPKDAWKPWAPKVPSKIKPVESLNKPKASTIIPSPTTAEPSIAKSTAVASATAGLAPKKPWGSKLKPSTVKPLPGTSSTKLPASVKPENTVKAPEKTKPWQIGPTQKEPTKPSWNLKPKPVKPWTVPKPTNINKPDPEIDLSDSSTEPPPSQATPTNAPTKVSPINKIPTEKASATAVATASATATISSTTVPTFTTPWYKFTHPEPKTTTPIISQYSTTSNPTVLEITTIIPEDEDSAFEDDESEMDDIPDEDVLPPSDSTAGSNGFVPQIPKPGYHVPANEIPGYEKENSQPGYTSENQPVHATATSSALAYSDKQPNQNSYVNNQPNNNEPSNKNNVPGLFEQPGDVNGNPTQVTSSSSATASVSTGDHSNHATVSSSASASVSSNHKPAHESKPKIPSNYGMDEYLGSNISGYQQPHQTFGPAAYGNGNKKPQETSSSTATASASSTVEPLAINDQPDNDGSGLPSNGKDVNEQPSFAPIGNINRNIQHAPHTKPGYGNGFKPNPFGQPVYGNGNQPTQVTPSSAATALASTGVETTTSGYQPFNNYDASGLPGYSNRVNQRPFINTPISSSNNNIPKYQQPQLIKPGYGNSDIPKPFAQPLYGYGNQPAQPTSSAATAFASSGMEPTTSGYPPIYGNDESGQPGNSINDNEPSSFETSILNTNDNIPRYDDLTTPGFGTANNPTSFGQPAYGYQTNQVAPSGAATDFASSGTEPTTSRYQPLYGNNVNGQPGYGNDIIEQPSFDTPIINADNNIPAYQQPQSINPGYLNDYNPMPFTTTTSPRLENDPNLPSTNYGYQPINNNDVLPNFGAPANINTPSNLPEYQQPSQTFMQPGYGNDNQLTPPTTSENFGDIQNLQPTNYGYEPSYGNYENSLPIVGNDVNEPQNFGSPANNNIGYQQPVPLTKPGNENSVRPMQMATSSAVAAANAESEQNNAIASSSAAAFSDTNYQPDFGNFGNGQPNYRTGESGLPNYIKGDRNEFQQPQKPYDLPEYGNRYKPEKKPATSPANPSFQPTYGTAGNLAPSNPSKQQEDKKPWTKPGPGYENMAIPKTYGNSHYNTDGQPGYNNFASRVNNQPGFASNQQEFGNVGGDHPYDNIENSHPNNGYALPGLANDGNSKPAYISSNGDSYANQGGNHQTNNPSYAAGPGQSSEARASANAGTTSNISGNQIYNHGYGQLPKQKGFNYPGENSAKTGSDGEQKFFPYGKNQPFNSYNNIAEQPSPGQSDGPGNSVATANAGVSYGQNSETQPGFGSNFGNGINAQTGNQWNVNANAAASANSGSGGLSGGAATASAAAGAGAQTQQKARGNPLIIKKYKLKGSKPGIIDYKNGKIEIGTLGSGQSLKAGSLTISNDASAAGKAKAANGGNAQLAVNSNIKGKIDIGVKPITFGFQFGNKNQGKKD